jgi:hypothetical protein
MQIDPYVKAALDRWLWLGLDDVYRGEAYDARPGVILGCAVWGPAYCQRFAEWCVPSLLEPRNAHALAASKSRVVIAAPRSEVRRLFHSMRLLEQAGISVQIVDIPLETMAEVGFEPNGQYWLLGVAQALMLRLTARMGMAYHMLMPDHVYGRGYFAELLRLSRRYLAIAQNTISANLETVAPELLRFGVDGRYLDIPPVELGDLGWRHLHKQMRAYVMNQRRRDWPHSHYMLWQGQDRLWIYSPHANVAYLSNEWCRRAPVVMPATLDSQLPKLMPSGAYIPEMADGMVLLELSDDDKPAARRVTLEECLACCAMSVDLRDEYLPWFGHPSVVPIHPQKSYTPAAKIQKQQKTMHGLIAGALQRIREKANGKEAIFQYDTLEAVRK